MLTSDFTLIIVKKRHEALGECALCKCIHSFIHSFILQGKEHHQLFSTDVYKETKVTLTGLQANTNYTIWMTASTSKEKGERSSETSVATCKLSL